MRRAIRALAFPLGAAVLAGACATAPVVTHTEYRYTLAAPTQDLRPGQAVPLTWKSSATVVTGSPPLTSARVCVAVAGPYASVEELKSLTPEARACPISVPRTVVASGVAEADITRGTPIDQPLTLPTSLAPGFYNLLSVFAYESLGLHRRHLQGSQGGSTSSGGIIRVVATP